MVYNTVHNLFIVLCTAIIFYNWHAFLSFLCLWLTSNPSVIRKIYWCMELIYVCMYVCMHVCMYVCIYVCMYIYIYIYIYICLCVCLCVCDVSFTPRPLYPWVIVSILRILLAGVVVHLMFLLDGAEKTVNSSLSTIYLWIHGHPARTIFTAQNNSCSQ